MSVTLHDSRPCELGEGPLWHPQRGALLWFDILSHRLLGHEGGAPRSWELGECASAAGWIDRDRLLIATETGLYALDLTTGARSRIAAVQADDPATRSNDGRADPWGGFWFGTMGKQAEPGLGAIWRYYAGQVTLLLDGLTIPNAICFDRGRRLAYFTDTADGRIMVQSLDGEGWPQGPARVFVDAGRQGLAPDGAVIDAEGAVWNAQWGAGRVARYLPDGRLDRVIDVPGQQTTCPAFGGPDLRQMFITTAREGLEAPDSEQGLTWMAQAGVAGLPEPRIIL